LGAW
jgi:nitric oxide reductase subunit B